VKVVNKIAVTINIDFLSSIRGVYK
jgi:hypothetical protein